MAQVLIHFSIRTHIIVINGIFYFSLFDGSSARPQLSKYYSREAKKSCNSSSSSSRVFLSSDRLDTVTVFILLFDVVRFSNTSFANKLFLNLTEILSSWSAVGCWQVSFSSLVDFFLWCTFTRDFDECCAGCTPSVVPQGSSAPFIFNSFAVKFIIAQKAIDM